MSKKNRLKDDFKGTGSLIDFVDDANLMFSAINNMSVLMPSNYAGAPPTLKFLKTKDGARIVLDFGDALVFSLINVEWVTGAGDVYVENGVLKIEA